MQYEMKKSLRRSGAKSYAQMEEQGQGQAQADFKYRQREGGRESIFEHKNWTLKEKVRLLVFLGRYHALPDWQSERRSIHLYKHLSTFLRKTRTPEQCKNIHSLLKRKFNSLLEVVHALHRELAAEDDYERLNAKYERELQKFEAENGLLEGEDEGKKSEFRRLRRLCETEKEEAEREREEAGEVQVKEYEDSENNFQVEPNNIKREDNPQAQERTVGDLAQQCQFYFNEWVKCAWVLEQRARQQEA